MFIVAVFGCQCLPGTGRTDICQVSSVGVVDRASCSGMAVLVPRAREHALPMGIHLPSTYKLDTGGPVYPFEE